MHGPDSFLAQALVKSSVFSNFLEPPNFIIQGWRMVLLVHLKGEIQKGKKVNQHGHNIHSVERLSNVNQKADCFSNFHLYGAIYFE